MKHFDFMKDPYKKGDKAISVANKKKRKLDLLPRLICLLLALVIWIYIVNLNDTDITSTMTLEIQVVGADTLADNGMMMYGMDKTGVTITVKGSNRDLKKYSEADYSAVVDVSDLQTAGKHTLPISIKTPAGSSISTTSVEPATVSLMADFYATKELPLNIFEKYIKISAYDYSIEKSSDTVKVSGPKSVVDKISYAGYTIEGEISLSKSFSGLNIGLFDRNGDYIVFDPATLMYSTDDITIKVNVRTQNSVPIVIKVTGEGSDLIATPERPNVILYGDPGILAQITEYTITLSEAVAGRNVSVTLTGEDLPEGVTVEGEGTEVQISFVYPAPIDIE
jgi:YbbR domain-containing protein